MEPFIETVDCYVIEIDAMIFSLVNPNSMGGRQYMINFWNTYWIHKDGKVYKLNYSSEFSVPSSSEI